MNGHELKFHHKGTRINKGKLQTRYHRLVSRQKLFRKLQIFYAGIMLICSQLANFSQFWSQFCHPWDQCKSGEKKFSPYAGGSGRLFLTAWPAPIYFACVRLSWIFARSECSLPEAEYGFCEIIIEIFIYCVRAAVIFKDLAGRFNWALEGPCTMLDRTMGKFGPSLGPLLCQTSCPLRTVHLTNTWISCFIF